MNTPNKKRNHEPGTGQGLWVHYTGFRFKDLYDIQVKDGQIFEHMRPNGNSWYGNYCNAIPDSDVVRICLKPDSQLDPEWEHTGQVRIDRQINLFGPAYRYGPVTIITEDNFGRTGSEEHEWLTCADILLQCRYLSNKGWEPQEIQVGESQETLHLHWWV